MSYPNEDVLLRIDGLKWRIQRIEIGGEEEMREARTKGEPYNVQEKARERLAAKKKLRAEIAKLEAELIEKY